MDVTALMDLLDKNKSNKSVEAAKTTPRISPAKKEENEEKGFINVQCSLSESEVHTPDNINEPLFAPNPMRYITIGITIFLTAMVFLGLVWMVDNKADDWFINVSNDINPSSGDMDRISPSAGGTSIEGRIIHDKRIAEEAHQQVKDGQSKPLIIPVDSNELLRLLSKKSTATKAEE